MTRSSSSSQELECLSRLPELVRILRSLFVMEKKAALPWETVMTKVVSSHSGSLSMGEVEKHINLLMKEVPDWCTSHKVRSGLYLKINKNSQISDVIDKLNKVIKSKE
ncbi:DNA replication factor Cdt1 [Armadillidium vulgare]|nr:DNA replication factor Cdt1 [Armadillidium vulgare]